jgi:hypothetical protein
MEKRPSTETYLWVDVSSGVLVGKGKGNGDGVMIGVGISGSGVGVNKGGALVGFSVTAAILLSVGVVVIWLSSTSIVMQLAKRNIATGRINNPLFLI